MLWHKSTMAAILGIHAAEGSRTMDESQLPDLKRALLAALPEDGSTIGNMALRRALAQTFAADVPEELYERARDELNDVGQVEKGRGRGGSVRRAAVAAGDALVLEAQAIPEEAKRRKPVQSGMPLVGRAVGRAAKPKSRGLPEEKVLAYRHEQRRINNPEVGLVTPDDDADERTTRYAWDPHIDPALQFDVGRAQVENLIDAALASGDEGTMRAALEQLKRQAAPYLNWSGKAERTSFEVDTVSLHVHERIDPATILTALKKRLKPGKVGETPPQYQDDFFQAWFDRPLPLREAIEFYKHDRGWANRLIAGDSLLVMNSLLQKEAMAGQVQMIYIDPPYGIRYGSNFQPFVNKRDVKDRKDEDLTQEPEMIKAFRDTWELGIHSYLTYLRDRLLLAKELLHESGSVFVQISDENVHLTRNMLDDVFGKENFCSDIVFVKTTGLGTNLLDDRFDYMLWYAKDKAKVKYRQLFLEKRAESGKGRSWFVELPDGRRRGLRKAELEDQSLLPGGSRLYKPGDMSSQGNPKFEYFYCGMKFSKEWKTTTNGLNRLAKAFRIHLAENSASYARFLDDFPATALNSMWDDTATGNFTDQKIYVVQTGSKAIERCIHMTTDPGDLVLDPTCGSGTTAFVAEKWGRRWITCDTSRVAITLAKQRLMTASYDYYDLKYPHEGLKAGFIYKTVPHVTLKSIANNPEIDDLYARLHPAIEQALADLNAALRAAVHPSTGSGRTDLTFTVSEGGRKGQVVTFAPTGVAAKGSTLTPTHLPAGGGIFEWEVPFDYPDDWPDSARASFDAFHTARQSMQKAMDRSIAAHADQETLYDQPQVNRDKLRITGPFTVEAVPFPSVLALNETGTIKEADASIARSGESARQHGWRDELLKTGIRGKNKQLLKFASLETLPDTRYLHCTGHIADTGERAVVSFGPEHAALEQRQVEMAMREAGELFPRPKMIVFCAFAFDPEAAKDIDNTKGIVALKAQMNTDLLTEDLKKARASNQSFWLMGQPDVEVRKRKDGLYEVEVNGFDYFDTTKGDLVSGGKSKIAAWSLDTDYDERSLFPRQVFFPMAGAKDGWNKLKRDIKAELDESRMARFHGTVSLPFEIGENRRIAVKIVDDRGIESLKVVPLD
jgi:adenine-specific DNA-methyltransferase